MINALRLTYKQRPILMISDIRAITHILLHNLLYEKVPPVERPLAQVVQRGLVVVIGEEHRMQRKALNPAFGPAQIQALTGVFLDKANEVCHSSIVAQPRA
jgi:cytochrome P450